MKNFGIRNEKWLDETTLTAGQPSSEQLGELAADGFRAVINIAPFDTRYSIDDEEGCVCRHGMNYYFLPVDFKQPTLNDFLRFSAIFRETEGRKRIVHCAANYRVSAFISRYQVMVGAWSTQQADEWVAGIWSTVEFPVWQVFIQTLRANLDIVRAV